MCLWIRWRCAAERFAIIGEAAGNLIWFLLGGAFSWARRSPIWPMQIEEGGVVLNT